MLPSAGIARHCKHDPVLGRHFQKLAIPGLLPLQWGKNLVEESGNWIQEMHLRLWLFSSPYFSHVLWSLPWTLIGSKNGKQSVIIINSSKQTLFRWHNNGTEMSDVKSEQLKMMKCIFSYSTIGFCSTAKQLLQIRHQNLEKVYRECFVQI